jgi:transglutaminase-like putative cysteine protease
MIYHITHKTWYSYANAVLLCQNLLHLHPREHSWQSCLKHDLSIVPGLASRQDGLDFFGNHQTWISLEEPHCEFRITAASEVRVDVRPEIDASASMPWEQTRDAIIQSCDPAQIETRQFIFDSPHITRSDDLADYALASFAPSRPLLEATLDLTERIHREFTFTPGATDLETSAIDVLLLRRGVCQDFAHLQIGCLRSLGLPARYVSGYLATKPPPGQPRLAGADVSHAWISVFDPNFGWVDFDPTNGLIPKEQHITLAWARDYDEVCPARGITVGGERQWLGVAVDVVPGEV